MLTKKYVLIPVYLIFAVLEAIAATALVAALALASDMSGLTSENVSAPASKILAAVIGLTVSWLVIIKWRAAPAKKLAIGGLVLVGTYVISVVISIAVATNLVGV